MARLQKTWPITARTGVAFHRGLLESVQRWPNDWYRIWERERGTVAPDTTLTGLFKWMTLQREIAVLQCVRYCGQQTGRQASSGASEGRSRRGQRGAPLPLGLDRDRGLLGHPGGEVEPAFDLARADFRGSRLCS
jgi:hypothetical protein